MCSLEQTSSLIIQQIKESFVNRDDDLKLIRESFKQNWPVRIVSISGDGGTGKTWLMYKAMMDFDGDPRYHVASAAIDFYVTQFHSRGGIQRGIVERLGEQYFPDYLDTIKDLKRLLDNGGSRISIENLEQQASETFITEFKNRTNLCSVVLGFDTFESILEHPNLVNWLLYELFPTLEGSCIIISGRRNSEIDFQRLKPKQTVIQQFTIEHFKSDDILALMEKRGVAPKSDKFLDKIAELTDGRPLLVELMIDWLKEDMDFSKILEVDDKEVFKEKLVEAIRDLRKPRYPAILYLAWAYRRCDVKMLEFLIKDDRYDYKKLVEELTRLSFVKYRKAIDSILLHDIMRELVVKYVWSVLDPNATSRIELSKRILEYYETNYLKQAKDDDERHILQTEMYFYDAYANIGKSYDNFTHVFDKLANSLKYDDCELLLWEMIEVGNIIKLPVEHRKEVNIRRARMWIYRSQFDEALKFINRLIKREEKEKETQFLLQMYLVRADCYDRTGEMIQALNNREKAVELARKSHIEKDIKGKAFSELGLSYRITGQWNNAIEMFETALENTQAPAEIANIFNTVGYIYALKTDYETALQYCYEGLNIRRKIGNRRGEAWSLSTIGEIMRYKNEYHQSLKYFQDALSIFSEGQDKENQARIYQQRGTCFALMKEYEEAKKDFDKAFEYYRNHKNHLEYPRALMRYGRFFHYQRRFLEAKKQYESALEFAKGISDVDTTVYTLFRYAQLLYEMGEATIQKLNEFLAEISQIMKDKHYQNNQHIGQMHILIGHKQFEEGQLEEALEHYCVGMRYLALQHTGNYLIDDYLNQIANRMESLDRNQIIRWCKSFINVWQQKDENGQDAISRHPELATFCKIRERSTNLNIAKGIRNETKKSSNHHSY